MKGAVNINTSPPTGHGHKTYRGSQPPPFETSGFNPLFGNSVPHHYVASSSETEKRSGGQWSPTTVLFESQWTTAFPGRARGDRVSLGLSAKAVGHRLNGSSPSTLSVPSTPTTKCRIYRSAGKPLETAMSSHSVSSDRTFLPSSRLSAQLQQSCASASAAPSQHVFPSAGGPQRSCGKARFGYRQQPR